MHQRTHGTLTSPPNPFCCNRACAPLLLPPTARPWFQSWPFLLHFGLVWLMLMVVVLVGLPSGYFTLHPRCAVTLLNSYPEIEYIVLRNILVIIQKYPALLAKDVKVWAQHGWGRGGGG